MRTSAAGVTSGQDQRRPIGRVDPARRAVGQEVGVERQGFGQDGGRTALVRTVQARAHDLARRRPGALALGKGPHRRDCVLGRRAARQGDQILEHPLGFDPAQARDGGQANARVRILQRHPAQERAPLLPGAGPQVGTREEFDDRQAHAPTGIARQGQRLHDLGCLRDLVHQQDARAPLDLGAAFKVLEGCLGRGRSDADQALPGLARELGVG